MNLFTRADLATLRSRLASDSSLLGSDPELAGRLLGQAEYALDCAALLEEAIHHPAEPYGECGALVARLTDGFNEIWNRYRYGSGPQAGGGPSSRPAREESKDR